MRNTYDDLHSCAVKKVEEYYALRKTESAKRDGVFWFVNDELADEADAIARYFDSIAEVFKRESRRFATGEP